MGSNFNMMSLREKRFVTVETAMSKADVYTIPPGGVVPHCNVYMRLNTKQDASTFGRV